MEVHHHRSPASEGTHTVRKKYPLTGRAGTHYFREFLMLFLAVFCGFLAEYKLEHTIEHQREKKYIFSMIKDIELDIASLQNSYKLRKEQISYFDSLVSLLKHGYNNRLNDFYFYARHNTRSTSFQYHDRTILQLKNSGNLRLIRNSDAADSITVYDNEAIKILMIQQENELELRKTIAYGLAGKILNGFIWDGMSDSSGKIRRPSENPSLITSDPALLNDFGFNIVALKATLIYSNRHVVQAIQSAENLMALLKKEYHLK